MCCFAKRLSGTKISSLVPEKGWTRSPACRITEIHEAKDVKYENYDQESDSHIAFEHSTTDQCIAMDRYSYIIKVSGYDMNNSFIPARKGPSQYFNQLSQYLVCVRIIYDLDRSTSFVAWETQLHDHNLQFSLLTKSTVFGGPPILISNSRPCYGFGCRGFSNLTSDESAKNVKQKIVLWQLE